MLASLPEAERAKALALLTDEQANELKWDWRFWARPKQLAPEGDWATWIIRAGRGFGKTRSGAGWVHERAMAYPGRWIALVARTPADARDYMIEGPGGLLRNTPPWERPLYEPSKRRVIWPNGAWATIYSDDEPDQLRGYSGDTAWLDEFAKFKHPRECWDNLQFGMREISNDRPRRLITTTPRPILILRELEKLPSTRVVIGTSHENRANLDPTWFAETILGYEGTRIGRQEVYAEIIDDAPGALWKRDMIRHIGREPDLLRIVVAVDPPASSSGESALAGIVVCGLGIDRRGYVLADYSGRMSPGEWGRKVIEACDTWRADRIVAEANQGGEMVRHTIQTVRENAPVTLVHASRGKQARAEPVAALYEQGKVDHVGSFPELEDEMCTWEPLSAMPSPDRLDAMVWAMTELAIGGGPMAFPLPIEQFVCDLIPIPSLWRQVCVIDIDHTHFAAVWGAWHRTTDTLYLTDTYLAPLSDLAVHAEAVRRRGSWIPILIDMEGHGRSHDAGWRLLQRLADLNLDVYPVPLDLEAGVAEITVRLSTSQMKVFSNLHGWLSQYRQFRRNDKLALVEQDNHLMRATALMAIAGPEAAITENRGTREVEEDVWEDEIASGSRSITGY